MHADRSGKADPLSCAANGGGKAGVIETNFREIETDLFSEQAALCAHRRADQGRLETLTEAGTPEMANFECLHDQAHRRLIYEGGIANMNY